MPEILAVLIWWLLITVMGLMALPIVYRAFPGLPDRGYAFAKPLGLLFTGLFAWIAGFFNFSSLSLWLIFLACLGLSLRLWVRQRVELSGWLNSLSVYARRVEISFILIYLGCLILRSHNPEIFGQEKFMDMAFLNAISQAHIMPPFDPWLAGESFTISYYYLGYLLVAVVVKLSGVPPAIGYNLALGLLFALAGTTVLGLMYNLTRNFWAALAAWAALFLLGNLAGCRQYFLDHGLRAYDWFAPSRVIPNTINEFPFFSFLLGDMHPHMFSLPYIFIAWAAALNHLKSGKDQWPPSVPQHWLPLMVWGIIIGALGFINSWDLPVAVLLALAALLWRTGFKHIPWPALLTTSALLLAMAVIPFLPFYIRLHSQVEGLGITEQSTRIGDYLLIFGTFTFMALIFLANQYSLRLVMHKRISGFLPADKHSHRSGSLSGHKNTPVDIPDKIRQPFWGWIILVLSIAILAVIKSWLLAFLILLMVCVLLLMLNQKNTVETTFALGLLLTAWLLVAGCEVLYIDDAYPPRLHRMNTVFKFYYQAWLLMGFSGVYGIYRSWHNNRWPQPVKMIWSAALVILVAASLVYPFAAAKTKTRLLIHAPTLDGSRFLDYLMPGDRNGIEWLRKHARGHPVVLEAIGPQHSEFARVSTFTGLPTVLGWAGHELQWRGTFTEPGRRIKHIDQILWGSTDLEETRKLIRHYRIEYVFIGQLELNKYAPEVLQKYAVLMDLVYANNYGIKIYRRRPGAGY